MKDSWNSESHARIESRPPVNGDVKVCQVTTKRAKNSTVDMIHRMSSLCLMSDLPWDCAGWANFRSARIDCISAIVPAVLLETFKTAVAYVNDG